VRRQSEAATALWMICHKTELMIRTNNSNNRCGAQPGKAPSVKETGFTFRGFFV
jgi:hypothetical protein